MNKIYLKTMITSAIDKSSLKKDIKKVSLFGSYVNGKPREDSDVDLLVEFFPKAEIGFFNFIGMKDDLERFIGKHVDLLTAESLSEYFRQDVLRQAEVIYEGTNNF